MFGNVEGLVVQLFELIYKEFEGYKSCKQFDGILGKVVKAKECENGLSPTAKNLRVWLYADFML